MGQGKRQNGFTFMVLICKKVQRKMYIKKSQDWRRKLIMPQYNIELRLIIRAQCNLHKGNPLRIDGNPGGSSLTFWIWNIHNFYVAKGTLLIQIYINGKPLSRRIQ